MTTWHHIDAALPDDEMTVLICVDREVWTGFREAGRWYYVSGDPIDGEVTHWADFPPPPEDI